MENNFACVKIKADGTITLVPFETPYLTLNDLHKHAECDTIQIVRCPLENVLMCIDDNGKILNKPINAVATALYGAWPMDCIVGTALVGISTPPKMYDEPDIYAMSYADALLLRSFLLEVSNKRPK